MTIGKYGVTQVAMGLAAVCSLRDCVCSKAFIREVSAGSEPRPEQRP